MTPRIWISELTFSDGTAISLAPGDAVVVVGPNNAGKSACLRAIRDKVAHTAHESPVVKTLSIGKSGTADEVICWVSTVARKNMQMPGNPGYSAFGTTIHENQIPHHWAQPIGLQSLARFFCHLLTADERLSAANPASAVALTRDPLNNPIHFLQRDDEIEKKVSNKFRKAFGVDLVVHRNAGNQVPLHIGERPIPGPGEDRVSHGYIERLEALPRVESQGDGMRSFAGVVLHTTVGQESILLIDEPEAFLHPPQARALGKMLAEGQVGTQQLFVATHSGDVLRGILDGNAGNVRVVRIRRSGDTNAVEMLDNADVKNLWVDPLLRFSNVLDGVFHEKVVVCESDGDARFFAAVGDALYDGPLAGERKPDVMFTHCGGKDRLPMVVRSLRALDVPVVAIADFDILNEERPLADLAGAASGEWATLRSHWNSVKTAIDGIRPQLSTDGVKKDIAAVLNGVEAQVFPKDASAKIKDILRQTSAWALAKKSGKSFVPSGTPTQEYQILVASLRDLGIFIIEVGELERFCPSIGGHGPAWVNKVMARDLANDPELADARSFVKALMI